MDINYSLIYNTVIMQVLLNSNLPVDVLGRVWDLSDIDGDGLLDRDEFTVVGWLYSSRVKMMSVLGKLKVELVTYSAK